MSLPSHSEEDVVIMGHCLDPVGDWMIANKLKLNPVKTKILLVRKSSMQVQNNLPTLNIVMLLLQKKVHSLGDLLYSQL